MQIIVGSVSAPVRRKKTASAAVTIIRRGDWEDNMILVVSGNVKLAVTFPSPPAVPASTSANRPCCVISPDR